MHQCRFALFAIIFYYKLLWFITNITPSDEITLKNRRNYQGIRLNIYLIYPFSSWQCRAGRCCILITYFIVIILRTQIDIKFWSFELGGNLKDEIINVLIKITGIHDKSIANYCLIKLLKRHIYVKTLSSSNRVAAGLIPKNVGRAALWKIDIKFVFNQSSSLFTAFVKNSYTILVGVVA